MERANDHEGLAMMRRIETVLEERMMKRAELARRTGITPNRFVRWFKGEGVPNALQAIAIADALRIPLRWLVGLQENRGSEMYERAISDISKEIGEAEALRWLLGHPEIQAKIKKDDPSKLDHTWVLPNMMSWQPHLNALGEMRNTVTGEPVDVIEYQAELTRRYEASKVEQQQEDTSERLPARADSAGRTEDGQEGEAS